MDFIINYISDFFKNITPIDILNYSLAGIIVLLSVLIFFFLFKFIFFKEEAPSAVKNIKERSTGKKEYSSYDSLDSFKKNNTKKKGKKSKKDAEEPPNPNIYPAEILLNFDRIYDGMFLYDSDTSCSMVIQCKGINFDLMSEEEKEEVNKNFISFFNKISFPIQIQTQTRVLNFRSGIEGYQQRQLSLASELKGMVLKFNDLKANHTESTAQRSILARKILKKQRLIEYVKFFTEDIKNVTTNAFIIQSNYYMVVSCKAEDLKLSKITGPKELDAAHSELKQRCVVLMENLKECGVDSNTLNTYQLVQLLYNSFDQGEENIHRITNLFEAGLFN